MPRSQLNSVAPTRVTRSFLESWPIPAPSSDDDKDARGRVLVVGGQVSIPGAVVLAGIAALRAGAGKLQIATCRSIAPFIGIAVPEALSLGLDETDDGVIASSATAELTELIENTNALLLGPGTKGHDEEKRFITNILAMTTDAPVVLDAGALYALADNPALLRQCNGNVVITPHAKEMAGLLGTDLREVRSDPATTALMAAQTMNAIVALKGSETFIASPNGDLYQYDSGDVGLATSGSGDTLAGVVAGLLARGCTPLNAALWSVFLHGSAGNRLAKRIGRVGYLARELLDEIPLVMRRAE
ncbi:MAG TPA: NAD(P)H-hydrate dehydratase [Gemmatimonadaceae bacterium]